MHRRMLKQPNMGKRKKGDEDDGTKGKKGDPRGRKNLTVVTVNTNKLKMTNWKKTTIPVQMKRKLLPFLSREVGREEKDKCKKVKLTWMLNKFKLVTF